MRSVGLKVLKNKLSEYVRLAERGETVLVTDRERVVAEIVPPQRRPAASPEAWWAEAIRKGWITPARVADGSVPPAGEPVATLEELMEELRQDREDR
jgi:antitoxin (DNA-binding transcriptional repressor) of toxin-antitoxin stability system